MIIMSDSPVAAHTLTHSGRCQVRLVRENTPGIPHHVIDTRNSEMNHSVCSAVETKKIFI